MAKGPWLKKKKGIFMDKCPKCGIDAYVIKKWVWNGGHLDGKYYLYYKHKLPGKEHFGHPLDQGGVEEAIYAYAKKHKKWYVDTLREVGLE